MVLIFSFALMSCADEWVAEVNSNTSWSGSFSGRTVDGTGNTKVNLGSDETVCCVVQKQTQTGYLKVSIKNEGGGLFAMDGESKETTAAYGIVSVCNK
jgi:hypothetical protein